MEQLEILPETSGVEVFITIFDPENYDLCRTSFEVANELRLTGKKVEVYTGEASKLGKQFDIANRRGIPIVVIIGPEEMTKGLVTLKQMASGHQVSVSRPKLLETIDWWLKT
jgi:histidyl-tRNA synthetase